MPRFLPLPYNPRLKALARKLRKKSTLAEVLLWQCISKRQAGGCEFHRQKPVDEFILDFFCPELMLAVEIDGGSHVLKGSDDEKRQRRVETLGIRFLRFSEIEVRRSPEGVARAIEDWIAAHRPDTPRPSATPL